MDPSFPGFPVTHGVLWKDGLITDLGTLEGGFESAALAVNSHGQVVGAADNTKPDAAAMFGFNFGWATQTRAFLWQDGIMQDLQTLGGPDAVAYLINDSGQVAGVSYLNSKPSAWCASASDQGYSLTTGAFFWENGTMHDIDGFGGTCTYALFLNDKGQVIGNSTLKGDQEQHPFLWDNGTLKDLGTFGGSIGSALWINNEGKVVGWATYPGDQIYDAALWDETGITDLGTLEAYSFAQSINGHEQVVGFSTDTEGSDSAGNAHAFLLIPCDENHPNIEDCDYSVADAASEKVSPTGSGQSVTQTEVADGSEPSPNGLTDAALRHSSSLSLGGRQPRIENAQVAKDDDINKAFSRAQEQCGCAYPVITAQSDTRLNAICVAAQLDVVTQHATTHFISGVVRKIE